MYEIDIEKEAFLPPDVIRKSMRLEKFDERGWLESSSSVI